MIKFNWSTKIKQIKTCRPKNLSDRIIIKNFNKIATKNKTKQI